ncbi:MAG: hypothetical protein RR646_04805 [Erysipelotrichaceae bacterium]
MKNKIKAVLCVLIAIIFSVQLKRAFLNYSPSAIEKRELEEFNEKMEKNIQIAKADGSYGRPTYITAMIEAGIDEKKYVLNDSEYFHCDYLFDENGNKLLDFAIRKFIPVSRHHILIIDKANNKHLFNVKENRLSNLEFIDIGIVSEYEIVNGKEVLKPYTDLIQLKGKDNQVSYYNQDEEVVAKSISKCCLRVNVLKTKDGYKEDEKKLYEVMDWEKYS